MSDTRILVVEDELIVARSIEGKLTGMGYSVCDAVASGDEAVKSVEKDVPDLVLMDIKLRGDTDGITAAQQILARREVPIIYLTAHTDDETLERAKLSQPYGYLIKPFEVRELRSAIEMALYKHKLERELKESRKDLQRNLKRSLLLNRVISSVTSTLEPHAVLETLCRELATELDVPQSAFALLNVERTHLSVVAEYRAEGRPSALGATIPISDNRATQYVLAERALLVIPNAQTDPRTNAIHDLERNRGTVSLLIVPLLVRDEVVGTLGLDATSPREFSPEDINLVQNVACICGQALENAQLFTKVQKELAVRKRTEEALRESEEKLRHFVEQSQDGIIMADDRSRIIEWNPGMERISGLKRSEVVGKNIWDVQLQMTPEESRTPGLCQKYKTDALRMLKAGQVPTHRWTDQDLERPDGTQRAFQATFSPIRANDKTWIGGIVRDVTERKRTEDMLLQHNRELELLNRVGQVLSATLDLDQVLASVLEEARCLLDVTACSVWLLDSDSEHLVCRQATGAQKDVVRGWRLSLGQGIAGWVARNNQSLVVSDTRNDVRHFNGVDEQSGLDIRSIITVPLRVQDKVIGVLQVLDTEANHFSSDDLVLIEPLATTAAIAIENARLYEQAQLDAYTKAKLLNEVNHRVKNNLTAIIGLLYTQQRHTRIREKEAFATVIDSLVGRIQGLATAHRILSSSEWTPVLLTDLIAQVTHAALQSAPSDHHISITILPSEARVTPRQANGLALIVHELVTNTVEFACRNKDATEIIVRTSQQDASIVLEFVDNGPGYPEDVLCRRRQNMGLYLLDILVQGELHGEATLSNDGGAVTTIRFPDEGGAIST